MPRPLAPRPFIGTSIRTGRVTTTTPPRTRRWLPLLLLALALGPGGCRKRATPEEQVRAVIARGKDAAEARKLAPLADLLSEQYRDPQGNDREAVLGLLRLHLLGQKSLSLFTRVSGVSFPGPGQANATVMVAMAGLPITDPAELPRLDADLYRIELVLREEEPRLWRIRSASWTAARPADFLQ